MKKIFSLFALIFLFLSCKSQHHIPNPAAVKLNDSAVRMLYLPSAIGPGGRTMNLVNKSASDLKDKKIDKDNEGNKSMIPDDSLCKFKLRLLNQAIKIDSDYFLAYWNKFGCEYQLKRFHEAVITGERMMKMHPRDTLIRYIVGKAVDRAGDTIRARKYYVDYLSYCNHILDTMPHTNRQYRFIEQEKGVVLILLDRAEEGHEIMKKLYQQDSEMKDIYQLYMTATRADFLAGKGLSITAGNQTRSVGPDFP
jgi:hypothetical protein